MARLLRSLAMATLLVAAPMVATGCDRGGFPSMPPAPPALPAPAPPAAAAPSPAAEDLAEATTPTPVLPAAASATSIDRRATLDGVTDGDTFVLLDGERVRILGVDTPERGRPFCAEATMRTQDLLRGRVVILEKEQRDRDRYGRLLRHAWIRDEEGTLVNVGACLVREGLARATPYPPDVARAAQLREVEDLARAEGVGLWKDFVAAPYYVGSRDKFHRPECPNTRRIKAPVRFEERTAAQESGRRAARCCHP